MADGRTRLDVDRERPRPHHRKTRRRRGGRAAFPGHVRRRRQRSEEHTSELQSLMRISYAVFCLKKKITNCIYPHTKLTSPSSKPLTLHDNYVYTHNI